MQRGGVMKYFLKVIKILFPFFLGGGILYWMYRGAAFSEMKDVLLYDMHWEWMLLSFIPGILAQVFRALRWKQSLKPIGENPRLNTCINAVFLSYMSSLVVPRSGEVLRCGVLSRNDSISFSKSIGTVVTERAVDSLLVILMCAVVFCCQLPVFIDFFDITGMSCEGIFNKFTTAGIWVTVICVLGIIVLGLLLLRKLSFVRKVKDVMQDMMQGIISVKKVNNKWLYLIYSLAIWICYFLHYYMTFRCFDFMQNISLAAGVVSFCVGTIAVIVPTPNGAGSWHFAVKTILVLYGLQAADAILFALTVHTIQTLLLVVLGIYAMAVLAWQKKQKLSK